MTGLDLTAALRTLGWSERQLAARLGVPPSTVRGWRAGRTRIPAGVAERLRHVTHVIERQCLDVEHRETTNA